MSSSSSSSSSTVPSPTLSPALERFRLWPSNGDVMNVTVIGAGNLCHTFAGLLGARSDVRVSILSRKANSIADKMMTKGVTVKVMEKGGEKHSLINGKVIKCSANPKDVIPSADIIIITVPSHARPSIVESIAPFISKKRAVLLGVMPGMGGFDYQAKRIINKYQLKNVILWAIKDVPYMCAWTVPGESVTMLGPKTSLYLALANYRDDHAAVASHVIAGLTGIPVVVLPSFLIITLTPGNPIIHPAIMYGMFGPHSQYDGKPLKERPLFYEECSELSAYFLCKCDAEVQSIKHAFIAQSGLDLSPVWPLRENLKKVYGSQVSDNRTLMLALRTNSAYKTIRTPLKSAPSGGFIIDTEHRFFLEDVPFGLVVLKDLAELLNVETPYIDDVLLWCQKLMGKEYLIRNEKDEKKRGKINSIVYTLKGKDVKSTGAPSVYGVKSVKELISGSTTKLTASQWIINPSSPGNGKKAVATQLPAKL